MKKLILSTFCLAFLFTFAVPVSAAGVLSLSQTNVNLSIGQNIAIFATLPSGQIANLTGSTNTNVATAAVTGNTINIFGLSNGSTQMTFCTFDNTCNSVFVNVGFGNQGGQISLSQNQVTMNVNDFQSVTVFNASNNFVFVSNNSNPNVVSATLSSNLISLRALNPGFSTLTICANAISQCATLNVTVNQNQGGGNITFSQNSVTLNFNQSSTVSIFANNSFNNNFYISNNSNPTAVSASISGNIINLYGQNSGTANITVCQINGQCGSLLVSVGGNNSGSLFFHTTFLPQPNLNQFYTSQLSVSGGQAPYTFTLNSGSVPPGLFLNNFGQISGTPYSTGNYSFTVRVNDNFGRSQISPNFNLNIGNVAGNTLYNNGTLINDNGTIYITYKNTKSAFSNSYAFTGLGYKFSNVISASTYNINFTGFIVNDPNIAHPWGSWIKSGSTIYFVHQSGLIPISSFDVFTSNGGVWASVVEANHYDFQRSILPVMVHNDQRLK